jgi:hypothetical protein
MKFVFFILLIVAGVMLFRHGAERQRAEESAKRAEEEIKRGVLEKRVVVGMTKAQVKQARGEPKRIALETYSDGSKPSKWVWTYADDLRVNFGLSGDKVLSVSYTLRSDNPEAIARHIGGLVIEDLRKNDKLPPQMVNDMEKAMNERFSKKK